MYPTPKLGTYTKEEIDRMVSDAISSTTWTRDDLTEISDHIVYPSITGISTLSTGTVSYIDPTLKVNRSNEALLKAFKSIAIGKPDVYARKIVKYYLEMDRLAPTEKLEVLKKDLIDMGITGL